MTSYWYCCTVADLTGSADCGWSYLISFIRVPELNFSQFVNDCLHGSCFLTLYMCVLQRLPTSQSLDDELGTLKLLVDWNSIAKPRCCYNICIVVTCKATAKVHPADLVKRWAVAEAQTKQRDTRSELTSISRWQFQPSSSTKPTKSWEHLV